MLKSTPSLLNQCILKTNRIDVWRYPLHTEHPKASQLLNPEEQQRAKRFYFPRHQRRFTNAHSILRLILSRYIKTAALELEFVSGKKGKPELINTHQLQFNLSHSKDMAMLAVGKQYPLGIDLEYFSARPYYGIGQQLFSPKEIQALQDTPRPLTPLAFFNIWVQKEAVIKACGLGLSYPTQQFDVPILAQTPQKIKDALHQKTWNIFSFMPEAGCFSSLCYDEAIQEIRYHSLSHDDFKTLSPFFSE